MMAEQIAMRFSGHRPETFKGQKGAILSALLARCGNWVPAYELSAIALQYSARIKELRDSGYKIENKTERVGRQVHGAFRLVSCPGETDTPSSLAAGGQ